MSFAGRLLAGVVLLVLVFGLSVFAEVPKIEGSADIYFTDNYFWRAVGDGDPHLQYDFGLSTTIAGVGLSFSPWVSHNLDGMDVDEVDYTVDLSYSIAGISANGGFIYYDVTGIDETGEIYGSVSYDVNVAETLTLSPLVTIYYDVMEVEAAYLEAGLSAGATLIESLSASVSATFGYDMGQYETESFDSGPTVLQIGISLDYPIMENTTLSPVFTYIVGLDDIFENDQYIGLNAGFSF